MKKLWVVFLLAVVMSLTGCGEEKGESQPSRKPEEQTAEYRQDDFVTLPDEGMYHQDNLLVTNIERDMSGRPALYMMEGGLDESEEPYAQIIRYSLSEQGEWDMNMICAESLTKRVKRTDGRAFALPYICRGDDGNLYALLQIGGITEEDNGQQYEMPEEEDTAAPEYSVLQLDEEKDSFYEVPLQTDSGGDDEAEGSQGSDKVNQFHVMEDGSPFLVFGAGKAVFFDSETGAVTSTETVTDRAFEKNVGFGEQEFIYYSSASKLFQVMDKDNMTVRTTFGQEIEESDRGKDWYFDTHTDDWLMYAFNLSGLYQIGEQGKKMTISALSEYGSFDGLNGATIYDVLVDEQENVYVLIRRQAEDSYAYDEQWDFGIVKYTTDKTTETSSNSSPAVNPGEQ